MFFQREAKNENRFTRKIAYLGLARPRPGYETNNNRREEAWNWAPLCPKSIQVPISCPWSTWWLMSPLLYAVILNKRSDGVADDDDNISIFWEDLRFFKACFLVKYSQFSEKIAIFSQLPLYLGIYGHNLYNGV